MEKNSNKKQKQVMDTIREAITKLQEEKKRQIRSEKTKRNGHDARPDSENEKKKKKPSNGDGARPDPRRRRGGAEDVAARQGCYYLLVASGDRQEVIILGALSHFDCEE